MIGLFDGKKLSLLLTTTGSATASLCDDTSDSASDRTGMLVQFDSGVQVLGWKFHESNSRVPHMQSAGPCNVYRERKRSKKSWYRLPLASERHMISAKWPSN